MLHWVCPCTLLVNGSPVEKPIDFDMIPKTERLDNQAAVTRPKMTHNPPSRTHIVSVKSPVFLAVNYNG